MRLVPSRSSPNRRGHCVLLCELAGKRAPWLTSRKWVNAIRLSRPYGTTCSREALCQLSQHSIYFSRFPPHRHKLFLRCRKNRLSVAVPPALGFPGTDLEPIHPPLLLALPRQRLPPLLRSHSQPRWWDLSISCSYCWTKSTGSWWRPQSLQQKGWTNEGGRPFSLNPGWMLLHPSCPSFPSRLTGNIVLPEWFIKGKLYEMLGFVYSEALQITSQNA